VLRFRCFVLAGVALFVGLLGGVAARGVEPEGARAGGSPSEAARVAARPRVLILGDSISLGYTPLVKKALEAEAEVLRPAENCQHTGQGLKRIDVWLGDGKWDVIHFNFGIWDTHLLDAKGNLVYPEPAEQGALKQRHTTEEYRKNLAQLIEKLEATGATLVWASTTPITSRKGERFEAIKQLNAAAAETAKAHKIEVDDLYEFVMPNADKWLAGDHVHFYGEANKQLADQVSKSIRAALAKREAAKAGGK